MDQIPEGFEPLSTASPFNQMVGPFYSRSEGDQLIIGLQVSESHCNTSGHLHGAMFAAIADVALGHNVGLAVFGNGTGAPIATINLNLDYSGFASLGDWVEMTVDVHKKGRKLAFANAYLTRENVRIGSASGIFSLRR